MKLTNLFCLVCFIYAIPMSKGADTETTEEVHKVLLYVQDLKEHVTRLEQRLADQNLKEHVTRLEQRLADQNIQIVKQEETIREQKKEFMRRFARQEETIRTLQKRCSFVEHRNYPSFHRKVSNVGPAGEKMTPEVNVGSTQPQDTVLQNENDTRKRSDDASYDALEPIVNHMTSQITEMTADIQVLKDINTRQDQEKGTSYIRWGHTGCPASAELVYSGITGGTRSHDTGGAANHLCLTTQPVFDGHTQPSGNGYASIYGSEYDICPETECQTTPACAACRVLRTTSVMIPGTNTCPSGWTKEYSGYIMAGYNGYTGSSEFICVDSNRKHDDYSDQSNDGENVIYYTHTKCGALPCPPYQNEKILTCVVCTK